MLALVAFTYGLASWYNAPGSLMADGHVFEPYHHVCAMRTDDHKQVVEIVAASGLRSWCVTEDYGPAKWTGRVIDVSPVVAEELKMVSAGVIRVKVYRYAPIIDIAVKF